MLNTIGLSIVYFKMLSIGTYVPMVIINYKYDLLDVDNSKIIKKYTEKFSSKFPKISSAISVIYSGSAKFGEKSASIIISQINKHTKANLNICPKKLTISIMKSSVMYKLMIPVYLYSSYSLAKMTLNNSKKH